MTKVHFMLSSSLWGFEDAVNEFIATHNVKDIQFRFTGENAARTVLAVMIVYEE